MVLTDLPLGLIRVFVTLFGLLWGSFLNVVIYRLPLEMSVVHPPSHCPGCQAPVKPWNNVPVFSYLLLRGKAACCGVKISPRYPMVELLAGILALAIFEVMRHGGAQAPSSDLGPFFGVYFVHFAIVFGLLAALFIDLDHMILPDSITLGGAALAFVTATLRGLSWREALVGTLVGFLSVWLPFIAFYKMIRGRPGMGLGDAKLLALAGAWLRWDGAVFALFAGAVQGTLAAAAIYLVKGKIDEPESVKADREELERMAAEGDEEAREALADDPVGSAPEDGFARARIPFGPFIILGCYEYLLAGSQIMEWIRVNIMNGVTL